MKRNKPLVMLTPMRQRCRQSNKASSTFLASGSRQLINWFWPSFEQNGRGVKEEMHMHNPLLERFETLFVSRASDYARQHPDGRYTRVGWPLTRTVLLRHLRGEETVGGYVIDEQGCCIFACFDADLPDGMTILLSIQA